MKSFFFSILFLFSYCVAQNELYSIVEVLPIFNCSDCGTFTSYADRNACSNEKLKEYISNNFVLPPKYTNSGIEGKVFVRFLVDEYGGVCEVEVPKGINEEIDACAIEFVTNFPKFCPATQQNKSVKCLMVVPIKI